MKIFIKYLFLVVMLFSCSSKSTYTNKGEWWKETVFYEIYMPSFKDSNGDGYGDFKGMTGKLNYIQSLGVKGIWLTPFLKSPMVDNGYDVSSYEQINEIYGTVEDFKIFIAEAHDRDIKVIMDIVVNHTSTEHMWFQESKKSKDNIYRDYYIWKDEPNNWESFFGGSAWEYDSNTKQYYYHQFATEMADLNWTNPKVVGEIQDVFRLWLDMGVDGFRLDVINFLTTEGITKDNPLDDNGKQQHLYDINQKGVKQAMKIIKETVNEYENRFIVGEIGSDKIKIIQQYQREELLDVVFNFNFGSIKEFSAQRIFDELQSMENNMSNYPTLFFGSHDMPRLMSRLAEGNPKRAEVLAALILTAKGVPFIYYGEEIGMENIMANSIDEMKDVQGHTQYKLALKEGRSKEDALILGNEHSRDKSRSPMQWNSNKYAGFSVKEPWIKVHKNYHELNVSALDKTKNSLLNKYKKLIALRNSEPVLQYGEYKELIFSNEMIQFTREYNGEKIHCFFNFSENLEEINLKVNHRVLFGTSILKPNDFLIVKSRVDNV